VNDRLLSPSSNGENKLSDDASQGDAIANRVANKIHRVSTAEYSRLHGAGAVGQRTVANATSVTSDAAGGVNGAGAVSRPLLGATSTMSNLPVNLLDSDED
jgi:hypothetical protein